MQTFMNTLPASAVGVQKYYNEIENKTQSTDKQTIKQRKSIQSPLYLSFDITQGRSVATS